MKRFNKRWLALIVAAVLAVSAIAVGLSLTYAANPVQERFKQENTYLNVVEKGRVSTFPNSGATDVMPSDSSIATVGRSGNSISVTGVKAGVMSVAVSSKQFAQNIAYQVTDSSLISGYDLANNGELNKKSTDAAFNINDSVTAYTTTWNATVDGTVGNANYTPNASAKAGIKWTSRNTGVATITAAGQVSLISKGTAVLLGEFTDRWGVPRTMTMLLGVDIIVGKTKLSDLQDAIKEGEAILNLNPNPYKDVDLGVLQGAVDAGKTLLTTDPNDTQIGNAIDAIEDAIDDLTFKSGIGDGIIETPNGNKYKRPSGPENVYEVLDNNGNSKVPPEYIYDPDGSLSDEPPTLGDEVPAYKDGYIYYAEEAPKGSNIFVPIKEDGSLDTPNAKWGGADKKPGGNDDRPATKAGGTWYAEDPAGSNLWKPVKTSTGAGQGTLQPAEDWLGGGANGKPNGTDNLFPIIEHDGEYYAGPFGTGDDQYYVGMGPNNKFDTSGYNSTGRPQGDNVNANDEKLYWKGTGTPGDGGTGGFTPDKPGSGTSDPTITGMTITGTPNKTAYTAGEPFNPAGLTITLVKSPGPNEVITSGFSGFTFSPLIAGATSVTVTHTASGETATVSGITVSGALSTNFTVDGIQFNSAQATALTLDSTTPLTAMIQVRETDNDTFEQNWVTYNAARHGGTLNFTIEPAVDGASITGSTNKALKLGTSTDSKNITVKASLVVNGDTLTKSKTFTVSDWTPPAPVEDGSTGVSDGRTVYPSQSGDSVNWTEIAKNGGYSLIVRDASIKNNKFGDTSAYVGSSAQSEINTWFAALGESAGLRRYCVESNATGKIGTFNSTTDGLSSPRAYSPSPRPVSGVPFLLSCSEALVWMTQAQRAIGAIWWLRSPGTNYSGNMSALTVNGDLNGNNSPSMSLGLRPAMWVSSEIFSQ